MRVKIAKNEKEINLCYRLREIVFIQEQNVPVDRERDEYDAIAVHFLLMLNGEPIGVARIVKQDGVAEIGRVGIKKEHRAKGAGLFLIKEIIKYCQSNSLRKIILGAQEHAIDFYKKLGFEICSGCYLDANIVHFKMCLELL